MRLIICVTNLLIIEDGGGKGLQGGLPTFQDQIFKSDTYLETCKAIKTMITRGAGSIGAAAGFAMMQAAFSAPENSYSDYIFHAKKEIEATRPTARDLFAATEKVYKAAKISKELAKKEAYLVAEEIAKAGKKIPLKTRCS